MDLFKKIFYTITIVFIVFATASFSSYAIDENETAVAEFYSSTRELLSVSHRGDTAYYPENSLEGVKSALEKGADFVSVNVMKTADGVFYLCEDESLGNICNAPYDSISQLNSVESQKYVLYDIFGNETSYNLCSLEKLLGETDSQDGIILDVKSEHKDELYNTLKDKNALSRVIIRVEENGSELSKWAETKSEKVYVIGKYTGNIIFSTIFQINALTKAEMPAVQYESKNYFNVAFGEFFTNRYLTSEKVRAVAATYYPDLCGQRGDSSDGWNELIRKGYSVIETNNIEAFNVYKQECKRLKEELTFLLEKTFYVDYGVYSDVSFSNLKKAEFNAKYNIVESVSVFSLDEAQQAYSQLIYALKDMKISTGEVDTRGALNITVGKVIWALIVGSALLEGQMYVYKMRKSNKEKT